MSTLSLRKHKSEAPSERQAPPSPQPLAVAPAPVDIGRFYFLWRADGSRPRQRHATLEAAIAERDRLRLHAPEGDFRVFEARAVEA